VRSKSDRKRMAIGSGQIVRKELLKARKKRNAETVFTRRWTLDYSKTRPNTSKLGIRKMY